MPQRIIMVQRNQRCLLRIGEGPTTWFNALPCIVYVHFANDYLGTPYKNIEFIFGSKVQLAGFV